VLEDPVLAVLVRDRVGRAEDALVVAGAGRPTLGLARHEARGVQRDEEGVDRAGVQRERLLLVEPLADRLVGAERDVGDVGEAVTLGVLPAGGDGDALDAARPGDPRLDRVAVAGRVGGDARERGDGAGHEVGDPAAVAGEQHGALGRVRRQAAAERDRALRVVGVAVVVEQDEDGGVRARLHRRRAGQHPEVEAGRADADLAEVGHVDVVEVAVVRRVADLVGRGGTELAGRILLGEGVQAVGLGDRVEGSERVEPLDVAAVVGAVGVEEVVCVDQLAVAADERAAETGRRAGPVGEGGVERLGAGRLLGQCRGRPGAPLGLRTDDGEGHVLGGGRGGGGQDEGQSEARDV
jgi:hypothetical protein